MKKIATFLASLFAIVLIPALAFAQEVAPQAWWHVILSETLQVFVTIAVPVLSTLITVLAARWFKVKLTAEQFSQLENIAAKAAGYAESYALKALREGNPKTSSAEKMKLALDFANSLVENMKLKGAATSKLQELIEGHLGQKELEKQPSKLSAQS